MTSGSYSSTGGTEVLTDLVVLMGVGAFFIKYVLPVLILVYIMIINGRIKNINELTKKLVELKLNETKENNSNNNI